MLLNPDRYWWFIPVSLLLAFLWQAWPLSAEIRHYSPDIILLTTLYWTLRKPHSIGSGSAFLIGLFRDALEGNLLGQHALAMIAVSYCVQLFHLHLRMLAVWQQSLAVCLLASAYMLICYWVYLLTHNLLPHNTGVRIGFLLPALTTGLCWPFFYLLFRQIELGRWGKTT
jgi:rod shape-determining protein MreD